MKTEITTESTGVMIPKAAKAIRVHTSWYTRLLKPEMKNSRNNSGRRLDSIMCIFPKAYLKACSIETFLDPSVLTHEKNQPGTNQRQGRLTSKERLNWDLPSLGLTS